MEIISFFCNCKPKDNFHFEPSRANLNQHILPEGVLEYFKLTQVDKEAKLLKIHLQEKDIAPVGYHAEDLESKGFLPEVSIQDFPVRGLKVALCIKRRRWTIKSTGIIISRDWDLVRKGTRMTTEFGLFLKGIFG